MLHSPEKPLRPQQSKQSRNRARTLRNWTRVEDYLTALEKSGGLDRAWELRGRLERGDVTLKELGRGKGLRL
jgi:hypothetical protein